MATYYTIIDDRYGNDSEPTTLEEMQRQCEDVWPVGCSEFDSEAERVAFVTLREVGGQVLNGDNDVVAEQWRPNWDQIDV